MENKKMSLELLLDLLPLTFEFDIGDPDEPVIGILILDRKESGWRANYIHKCVYPDVGEEVATAYKNPTISTEIG